MDFKSPCKETAIKVENHALLGMSRHLVINTQNGYVFGSLVRMSQSWEIRVGTGCVYLSPNLGSLWEWAKDWSRSEPEVLVAFYVNPGNARSPA